ncbi:MAG: hypothetical protein JF614_01685 [Acidobacteria bacterium]|nr:hypothetical protein [Acidobacteriota bacterium]
MKTNSALLAGLLLVTFAMPALCSAQEKQKQSAPVSSPVQTVVVYQASGGNINASTALIVYTDGMSVLSCSRGGSDKISRVTAPAAKVKALQNALLAANALSLPSSTKPVPDIQLKIVTFFKPHNGAGQTPSNTFSYMATTGDYGKVQAAIDAFISSVFPAC